MRYLSLLVANGILSASQNEGSPYGATYDNIDAYRASDGHLLWYHSMDTYGYLHGLASQGSVLYLLLGVNGESRQTDSLLIVLRGKSGKVLRRVPVRTVAFLLSGAFLYTGIAGNSSSICAAKSEDQITQFRAQDLSQVWQVQFQGGPPLS